MNDASPVHHVLPLEDLIHHDAKAECVCGPTSVPVKGDDGSFGWIEIHHSLDGRERDEK